MDGWMDEPTDPPTCRHFLSSEFGPYVKVFREGDQKCVANIKNISSNRRE